MSLHQRATNHRCVLRYTPIPPSYHEHENDGIEQVSEAGIYCPKETEASTSLSQVVKLGVGLRDLLGESRECLFEGSW